jgi:hypothetical protein
MARFGRAGTFIGDQTPRWIFVGPGMTPDVFLAVIAQTVEMHFAIIGRPETGTYSAQRIWDHREMLASHRLVLR